MCRHEKVLKHELWLQQFRLENSQSTGIRRKVLGVNNKDCSKTQIMISQKRGREDLHSRAHTSLVTRKSWLVMPILFLEQ